MNSPQNIQEAKARPWLVISATETILLHAAGWLVFSYLSPEMHLSPRQDELFWWAPGPLRFWLLALTLAAFNGPISCIFPLLPWVLIPGVQSRFPIRGGRGSPPLVGAAIATLFTLSLLVGICYLASFED